MSMGLIDPAYLFADLPLSPFPHEMATSLRTGSPFTEVSLVLSVITVITGRPHFTVLNFNVLCR